MAMHEFRMPSLGADMEAGTLVEWHIKPGDAVKRGDIVAVVETQKGAIEVEILQDGIVEKLLVRAGQKVPVGAVLATLIAEGEAPGTAPAAAPQQPAPWRHYSARLRVPRCRREPRPMQDLAGGAQARAKSSASMSHAVQPAAADGVITRADVERARRPPKAGAPPKPGDWQSQMRKAIAAAMARSKREIPHYYLGTEIDMTRALAWLAARKRASGRSPSACCTPCC